MRPPHNSTTRLVFWARWILVCACGCAIGAVVYDAILSPGWAPPAGLEWAVASAFAAAVAGIPLGVLQWLLLGQCVRYWTLWVLATASGAGIGWLVAQLSATLVWLLVGSLVALLNGLGQQALLDPLWCLGYVWWALPGTALGAALGTLQWFVLRREVTRSGKWVLASAVGGAPAVLAIQEIAPRQSSGCSLGCSTARSPVESWQVA
jgi:hypothetical protein